MRVRVAIVDDSSFVRKALVRLLRSEQSIDVVGVAATGEELLDNLDRWRPDVVTLDLEMPGMGGLATLDRLRIERPIPVIILSDHLSDKIGSAVEALHRYAVDHVDKRQFTPMDFSHLRAQLVDKIFTLIQAGPVPALPPTPPVRELAPAPRARPRDVAALLIGASTGGPPAIQTVLSGLGGDVRVPVLVVQHMPVGFTGAFARRLDAHLPLPVREAADGEPLVPGVVHIAPAGAHLRVRRRGETALSVLDHASSGSTHKPSVDVLFHSARLVFGDRVVALLLTGMGADGADGLAALARAGAYTIGQSEASCVVYGMPRIARSLGAVTEELDLHDIAPRVTWLLGGKR